MNMGSTQNEIQYKMADHVISLNDNLACSGTYNSTILQESEIIGQGRGWVDGKNITWQWHFILPGEIPATIIWPIMLFSGQMPA